MKETVKCLAVSLDTVLLTCYTVRQASQVSKHIINTELQNELINIITARSELWKVLFLVQSICVFFVFVYEISSVILTVLLYIF